MNEKIIISLKEKKKNSNKISGVIIREDDSFITIKLNSGYNSTFKKDSIEIINREKVNLKKNKKELVEKKVEKNLPRVLLLHTGGTIASKVDYSTGAVSSKFNPEEILEMYSELKILANLDSKLISNIFSEEIRFSQINNIIKEISEGISKNYDGIILTHGTDTMHYTSSILHYFLSNLPIPILLVGAQRSSDRPSSDAFLNLKSAVNYIKKTYRDNPRFRGVGIVMHRNLNDEDCILLRGINVKKSHSSRRDAFRSYNEKPIAILKKDGTIENLREDLFTEKKDNEFSYNLIDEKLKIGFFKSHPNIIPEEINALSFYDGVIIEATGLGNLPGSLNSENAEIHKEILNSLKKLKETTKIVISSQTGEGIINQNVYSSSREVKKIVNIGHGDKLVPESCFSKLLFILSTKKDLEKVWNEIK